MAPASLWRPALALDTRKPRVQDEPTEIMKTTRHKEREAMVKLQGHLFVGEEPAAGAAIHLVDSAGRRVAVICDRSGSFMAHHSDNQTYIYHP